MKLIIKKLAVLLTPALFNLAHGAYVEVAVINTATAPGICDDDIDTLNHFFHRVEQCAELPKIQEAEAANLPVNSTTGYFHEVTYPMNLSWRRMMKEQQYVQKHRLLGCSCSSYYTCYINNCRRRLLRGEKLKMGEDEEDVKTEQFERRMPSLEGRAKTRFETCVENRIKSHEWQWNPSPDCSEALAGANVTAGVKWG